MLVWTAIYVGQAVFWVWLAREATHDRPRTRVSGGRSAAEWLWRYDASVTRWTSWTILILTSIAYVVALVMALSG
jgi:hypothetical protein